MRAVFICDVTEHSLENLAHVVCRLLERAHGRGVARIYKRIYSNGKFELLFVSMTVYMVSHCPIIYMLGVAR